MIYFGLFAKIRELSIPGLVEGDLYEDYYANFYDRIIYNMDYDIEVYKQQAAFVGSPILELACGTGRVTIKLAKAGYKITGIDISMDMLKILEDRLSDLEPKVREKINLVHGDISSLSLKEEYQMIILPATTICLLDKKEMLEGLFEGVYNHLVSGGRFVFDFRVLDETYNYEDKDNNIVRTFTFEDNPNQKEFVLMQENIDISTSKAIVNFYAEVIENNETKRFLGNTVKNIVTDETIRSYISKFKFKIIKEKVFDVTDFEKIKFYIVEK